MNDTQTGQLQTSKREIETAIPVAMEMSVRDMDWKRIYRKIKGIPRETSIYRLLAGVAWGVSGSSFLFLFSLSEGTLIVVYLVIGLAAAIVGLVCFKSGKEQTATIRSSCQEVLRDMVDVYETCFPGKSLESRKE